MSVTSCLIIPFVFGCKHRNHFDDPIRKAKTDRLAGSAPPLSYFSVCASAHCTTSFSRRFSCVRGQYRKYPNQLLIDALREPSVNERKCPITEVDS
ncbi:hypothetical protein Y032_1153g3702 [Ancylostoma ceylanicum]|uniref:Uncharacterized protein n=1 Tax=Ancylostoma ceylanicum TaxID=53326 RepID=A0A016W5K4_9BILA|nr:hypothetical protein Y032_1153g3702 [Ancylostoma ceylanicum]